MQASLVSRQMRLWAFQVRGKFICNKNEDESERARAQRIYKQRPNLITRRLVSAMHWIDTASCANLSVAGRTENDRKCMEISWIWREGIHKCVEWWVLWINCNFARHLMPGLNNNDNYRDVKLFRAHKFCGVFAIAKFCCRGCCCSLNFCSIQDKTWTLDGRERESAKNSNATERKRSERAIKMHEILIKMNARRNMIFLCSAYHIKSFAWTQVCCGIRTDGVRCARVSRANKEAKHESGCNCQNTFLQDSNLYASL